MNLTIVTFNLILCLVVTGYASAGAIQRIFGGKPVDITSVPYMAIWRPKLNSTTNAHCGAAIVDTQFLVTAAHCQNGASKIVTVGTDTLRTGGQNYEIQKLFPHPKWNQCLSLEHDILVIKLKKKLVFSNSVAAISMAPTNIQLKGGSIVETMGFGMTKKQKMSKHLLQVSLPFIDNNRCKKIKKWGTVTKNMICAGGARGRDSCNGDSGGPLVYNNLLLGVVSWGALECGTQGLPGVYSSIPAYRSFIDHVIQKHA